MSKNVIRNIKHAANQRVQAIRAVIEEAKSVDALPLASSTGYWGNSAKFPYSARVLINLTKNPYLIADGYDTVHSYAERIVCPAGGYAYLKSKGSPRDFATWLIGNDITDIIRALSKGGREEEYKGFDDICILFPGKTEPCHWYFEWKEICPLLQINPDSQDKEVNLEFVVARCITYWREQQ